MQADEAVALAILATFFLLLALERLRPARGFPAVRGWRWLGLGFLALLFALNGLIPALVPAAWMARHSLLDGHQLGVAAGAVAGFLAVTFTDYWLHRAYHFFDGLWRWVHQLHHSAERVDMYGAAYAHPLEIAVMVLEGVVINLWLLGLDPLAAALAGYAGAFCAMFQHWNVSTPRWVGWFIQRPEAHCYHHGRGLHGFNYGNLSLWDMLFGTFHNPARFEGAVGFEGGRGGRVADMLLGRDVHAGEPTRPYATARNAQLARGLSQFAR